MINRRTLIAGIGSIGISIGIAGCSEGDSEMGGEGTPENSDSETEQDDLGGQDTDTEQDEQEAQDTDTEQSGSPTYQVRISYDGEWSGSIGGESSTRSVDGSGTETFDIEGDPFIVSANGQKEDDGSGELTVEILKDGTVIASESTTASYGVAQVTSEDGTNSGGDSGSDSDESSTTFEVRVQYDGEWQGAISSGGSSRSVQGSGPETFEIEGSPDVISANAQKKDDSSDELTIQILEDGEVVEETSTTASYGVAQVSYSGF